jgi:AraC family transcriptional regulator of adaptative response/methylated-DNA-[protein]-cysteine methyltransferase
MMRAEKYAQLSRDYKTVEQAIRYLEIHRLQQPSLGELANNLHLSEYHLQRLFSRWAGISPKRFLHFLTKEHAKQLLNQSRDLMSTSHSIGLSGPGRLHDMFINYEAMTPGEYKGRGDGICIRYCVHATPFGECLVGVTRRGICYLGFVEDGDQAAALLSLSSSWPAAELHEDQARTGRVVDEMLALFRNPAPSPLRILLRGTNFQIKVWEALLRIPAGTVVAYQDVALQIGTPGSARAVGRAISNNRIPVLIPCHRVIQKDGEYGNYRFGTARKKALLGWEMAQADRARADAARSAAAR